MSRYINVIAVNASTPNDTNITDHCTIIHWNATASWNQPDTLISADIRNAIDLYRSAIVMPVLFVIGFPTNILNMLVFFRQGLGERINLCLFLLALVDVMFITFLFIFYSERMRGFINDNLLESVHLYIVEKNITGLYGLRQASAFMSAVISFERCVCVLFPLRAQTCISTKHLGIIIVLTMCVIAFPYFVVTAKYHVACFYDMRKGRTKWQTTASEFYFQNKEMYSIMEGIVYGFCLAVGCPVIVLITTIITAIKLQQTIRWRQRSSSSMSDKETGVTKMLIWLSVEFLVLSIPFIILRISPMFDSRLNIGGHYANLYKLMIICSDLCSYMSSCVNFFVYYFTGSKYRETLHRLLRRKTSTQHSQGKI